MSNPLRLLSIAAVMIFGMAASAAAQTVMVRGAVPGESIEVVLNGAVAGTGTIDATGVGTAGFTVPAGNTGRPEMNARLFIESCGKVRRVHIVEQNRQPPDAQADCPRSDVGGVYWIRQRSTIVVNVANPIPMILLRQGSYNPNAGRRRLSPTGVVLFGGGGLAKFPEVFLARCGAIIQECSGDDSVGAYSVGAAFWVTRWLGMEASYTKPSTLTGSGIWDPFTFTEEVDVRVVSLVGKLAAPIGPVRLYAQGGGNWHEGTGTTVQTLGTESQTLEFKAEGWGWTVGGGIEAWVSPRFALYGEANVAQLKGEAIDNTVATFENRMRTFTFGARVKIF